MVNAGGKDGPAEQFGMLLHHHLVLSKRFLTMLLLKAWLPTFAPVSSS
jgi:hypothetical protein